MLYGSKCWALTTADVQRLQRNEPAMARWICKDHYKISSDSLLNKLCSKNLDITLRTNCLQQFGHICCSEGWIKQCTQHEVAGKRERDRARKTQQQCVNCNLNSSKLSKDLTTNRNAQREALRMTKSPTCKKCGTQAQSGQVSTQTSVFNGLLDEVQGLSCFSWKNFEIGSSKNISYFTR